MSSNRPSSFKELLEVSRRGDLNEKTFKEICISLSSQFTTSNARNKKVRGNSTSKSKRRYSKDLSYQRDEVKAGPFNLKEESRKGLLVGSFEVFEFVLNTLLEKVGKREQIPKVDIGKAILQFQALHNNLIIHHGIIHGTKKWNAIKLYCIQKLEGIPNPEHPPWVASGRIDGWPRAINVTRQLFHQVRDNGPYRQVGDQIIRSLFAMNRVVEENNSLDLSSIEFKAKVDPNFLKEFSQFLDELLGDCEIKGEYCESIGKNAFHINTKIGMIPYDYEIKPPLSIKANGPNLVPKVESAPYEAYLMVKGIGSKELYPHLKKIVEISKINSNFINFIESSADLYLSTVKEIGKVTTRDNIVFNDGYPRVGEDAEKTTDWACSPTVNESRSRILRKITSVYDSGNKSRVVAIPDYWTQCSLEPFENNVINAIKVIYPESSNIFDHPGGFRKLQNAIKPGTSCLDATSWTDTFSSKVQKKVVSKLFGAEFCSAWAGLVVHCHWNVKNTNRKIRYLTGQGMGTKGSFQIASLTYLLVMEFLTKKNYNDLYEQRRKSRDFLDIFNQIGDDSWNHDPDGSVRRDLQELVGMPINLNKSKFATESNLVGEYVSRNINYGKDVSRISLNLCRQVGKNIFFLPDLVAHLEERTESFDICTLINFLRNRVKPNGKTYYKPHIWSSLYKSMIVDNIIHDDKVFYRLLVDLERSLSQSPEKENDLTILRSHFSNTGRLMTLKMLLILQDCEYMYSQIEESFELSNLLYKKYPFGKYTEIFNGEHFLMTHVIRGMGLSELSSLRAAFITKSLLSGKLFKLSLNTFDASNMHEFNSSLVNIQNELATMHKDCVYGKSYENRNTTYKHRVDRCYKIQATYVGGKMLPETVISEVINLLPNLSLIGELSHDTFVEMTSHMDTSYPIHESEEVKSNPQDNLGKIHKEVIKGDGFKPRPRTVVRGWTDPLLPLKSGHGRKRIQGTEDKLERANKKLLEDHGLDSFRKS